MSQDKINPAHYRDGKIETIDKIRNSMSPEMFVGFCLGNAMKYEERAGKKAGESAESDKAKAAWYRQMLAHVQGFGHDPREKMWAKPGEAVPPWPSVFVDRLSSPTLEVTLRCRGEDWLVTVDRYLAPGCQGMARMYRVAGGRFVRAWPTDKVRGQGDKYSLVACLQHAIQVVFETTMEATGGEEEEGTGGSGR